MFSCKRVIHLQDTDATGVLYFAQQLRLALEVFEEFLQERGLPLRDLLLKKEYLMPIVHAEADYFSPLFVGDSLIIQLSLQNLGTSSFSLGYRYFDEKNGKEKGKATIVHVTTSKKTWKSMPIPKEVRECVMQLEEGFVRS